MDYVYYCTTYRVPSGQYIHGTKFSNGFIAKDVKDAEEIVKVRSLNETIVGYGEKLHYWTTPDIKLTQLLALPFKTEEYTNKLSELLHQVCFLLFLGEKSGRFVGKDLFSDFGLVHQLVHLLSIPSGELGSEFDTVFVVLKELADSAPEMFKPKED